MPHINFIDILIIIPVIWFSYKGFKHGLIMELASLLALVAGIWITFHFSDMAAKKFGDGYLARALAFALLFTGTLILGYFAGKMIEKVIKLIIPSIINNLFGLLFGAVKVLFVFSCIFYFINMIDKKELVFKREFKEHSLLYHYVEPIMPIIRKTVFG